MKLITDELLINLAGEGAFGRGLKLFEQGEVLSIEPVNNHYLAKVQGTQTYSVDIIHTQRLFQGSCNCPASDNIDFCKHCVAVALHLKQGQTSLEQTPTSNSTKKTTKQKQIDTIQQYLSSLTKPELEKGLLNYIEHQPDLRAQWLNQAENQLGLIDYKALRKKITATIPYNKHLFYYDQVQNYFAKIEQLAEQIEQNSLNLSEEELFKLAEYGLQRLDRALDTIDDSGGFRFQSQSYFEALLVDGFAEINWSSKKKIEWLFNTFTSQSKLELELHDFYRRLTPKEQQQLNDLAEQTWNSLESYELFNYEQDINVFQLQHLLIQYAESNQDWAKVIAIYEKTATHFRDQTSQLEREIEYQLYPQAESRLVTLKGQTTSNYELSDLYKLEVKLATQLKQTERKIEAQWQLYKASEKIEDLKRLLEWESNPKTQENRLKEAENLLKERLIKGQNKRFRVLADNLIELYLYQGNSILAYELINSYLANDQAWLQIARHSNTPFKSAWNIYQRLIIQEVDLTNNNAYKQALKLIQEAASKADKPLEKQLFKKEITQLREEYKRKVNFTKWLDERLPDLLS